MADPVTLSYLKGEITFEDYANIIENQNLKSELLNETVIEYTANLDDNLSNKQG